MTAQGVLGEQFLAINPGSPDKPPLEEGAEVKGIDPPRLDLFLAKAYELLDTTVNGINSNREELGAIIDNTAGLLKGLNFIVSGNRERIERTMANIEDITVEAKQLTHDARVNYVDNPKVLETVNRIDDLVDPHPRRLRPHAQRRARGAGEPEPGVGDGRRPPRSRSGSARR